jgi:hypothetical protein
VALLFFNFSRNFSAGYVTQLYTHLCTHLPPFLIDYSETKTTVIIAHPIMGFNEPAAIDNVPDHVQKPAHKPAHTRDSIDFAMPYPIALIEFEDYLYCAFNIAFPNY